MVGTWDTSRQLSALLDCSRARPPRTCKAEPPETVGRLAGGLTRLIETHTCCCYGELEGSRLLPASYLLPWAEGYSILAPSR